VTRGSGRNSIRASPSRLKDATPFQNWMYRHALAVGYRVTDCKLEGETPSLPLRLANRAAYWLVFRNIRRMLGLDRCRLAFTVRPRSRRT